MQEAILNLWLKLFDHGFDNGKDIHRRIKIKGAEDAPTLKDERVPTKEELKGIFLSGDKKARVASGLLLIRVFALKFWAATMAKMGLESLICQKSRLSMKQYALKEILR